jgi:predicted RNase H-like nuclease (RuvC/YqgF family)
MTEEIIIDGVNVAGCEFAVKPINDNRIKCHCVKGLLQIAKMHEQPESVKSGLCENNPNCYYKQLKRLEQENKELEAYKDINEDFKKAWGELNEKYKQLRSALEEIRILATKNVSIENFVKIQNKINEVLQ